MCQEFHCECCSDDVPQLSCECVECFHEGTEDSSFESAEHKPFPDTNNDIFGEKPPWLMSANEEVKSPCCKSESPCSDNKKNDEEEAKENPCSQATNNPCCSKEGENANEEGVNKPCCASSKETPKSPANVAPCCSDKKEKTPCSSSIEKDEEQSNQNPCCSSDESDGETSPCCSKEKEVKEENPCSSEKEEGEESKTSPCCSSKSEQEKPCCSSKKNDEGLSSTSETKTEPCCSSKKEEATPCCPSKQAEVKPCCSSNQEKAKPCCASKQDAKPCCMPENDDSSKEEVKESKQSPCCSSKGEQEKPCCSSKKNDENTSGYSEKEKEPCCSSKKEEAKPCCPSKQAEVEPCSSNQEKAKPCCMPKNEEDSLDKPPCCSADEDCCAENKSSEEVKPCCSSKQEEKPCCMPTTEEDSREKAPCCSPDADCCAENNESSDEETDLPLQEISLEETHQLLNKSETSSVKSYSASYADFDEGPQQTGKITTKLRVQNICCALEGQLVKDRLKPLEGIENVAVNVIGRVVHVRHDQEVTSVGDILDALNKVHLGATVMEAGDQYDTDDEGMPLRIKFLIAYVAIQTVLLITAVVGLFMKTKWFKWVAIAEIIFGAAPILKRSLISAKNLRVDINVLMLIAIAGTVGLSEWVEGATVVFVFAVADVLQAYAFYRVQKTISSLMLKRPQVAVLVETGEPVDIESVVVGTLIAVRPGELIPLDGIVVKGRASVDESSITGESLPVEKKADSTVFSGTVDQNGYLEIKTTTDSSSSTVSKVASMVQEAQSGSTQTEAMINRFAKYYTPLVVVTALLIIIFPAILGAAGVGTYLKDISEWGHKALVLLVVACPCALVMSSPIAVVCSITAAARRGSLVKGGDHLETLAKLDILAFDKTGTLTEGKFQVTNTDCSYGVDEREALRLAAGVENKSSHPIAAAIVNEFSGCVASMVQGNVFSIPEVQKFKMHEGKGISGMVEGKKVLVGNREMLEEGELGSLMEEKYLRWSSESKTVVFVCVDDKLVLMIALADAVRPNTRDALNWLQHHGVQTAMITGDNARTAAAVKEQLGLDECISEMKPDDKLGWIRDRQGHGELTVIHSEIPRSMLCSCCPRRKKVKHSVVGMVGDGVNDGPALAAADLGIAMGAGGTALAVEAADVTLMSNNLAKIPELISLGKFCRIIVAQNIAVSVILKLILMVVALMGYAALWMAVVGDALGLLFVILNGLRPLLWKASETYRKGVIDMDLGFAKPVKTFYTYESFV